MRKTEVYARHLIEEMGFPELCNGPTPTAGDNLTTVTQV
eukprot:SAG31_NODE_19515_length_599_cov_1.804000_1_plen_38_part_10